MTSIPELASSIRPVAIADLSVEARGMHTNEALPINLDGRAFVVITADEWVDLVEVRIQMQSKELHFSPC